MIGLTIAGQPVILANVHVAKMPKDLPGPAVAPTPSPTGMAASAPAAAVPKPGEFVVELPATPDSVTSRLADNQKCVKDKKGEACLLEGSIALIGPDGSTAASYFLHAASIKDLSLKGHAGDAAGRPGRMTIKYDALEARPPVVVASAPGPVVTTTSPATLDTPVKKHKGFGKFVVGLVKDHGLQVVEIATGMTMASMLVKNFSLAKGANGALSPGSQSQVASLAKLINTSSGARSYNIGAPPAGLGFGSNAAGQQAYLAMVRQQLVAHGADTSKFTLSTGASGATTPVAGQVPVPGQSPTVAAASVTKAH